MNEDIEIIAQIVPKNDSNFPVTHSNYIKGGIIYKDSLEELKLFSVKYSNRLIPGLLGKLTSGAFYQWSGTLWEYSDFSGREFFALDTEPLTDGLPKVDSLWVNTAESTSYNVSNSIINSLLATINVLAQRIDNLEYMHQQIQSGGFTNNMFNTYDSIKGIEPLVDASSLETDDITLNDLLNTLLSDSPEPTYANLPNVKHILIKYGTYEDMVKYQDNFLPAELLWCFNTKQLWIKDPYTNKLIQVATSGSNTNPIIEDIMNGIIQSGDYIGSISFVDMIDSSKHWSFGVQNGEVNLYDESLNTPAKVVNQTAAFTSNEVDYFSNPYLPVTSPSATNSLIFINSVYGAGLTATATDYNLHCDHNFIEIANITNEDLNLNGLFLHYTQGAPTTFGGTVLTNSRLWITLPLKGIVKAGTTFLIRGALCGVSKYAKLKVKSADMYWTKSQTLLTEEDSETPLLDADIWDEKGFLKFDLNCSFYLSGPLYPSTQEKSAEEVTKAKLADDPLNLTLPWISSDNGIGVSYGFIDLVGFGTYTTEQGATAMPSLSTQCSPLDPTKLQLRYFYMDNVAQAYKSVVTADAANNKMWTTIKLDNTDLRINLEGYQPKTLKDQKTFFTNKHLLIDGAPQTLTCTFGYNPHSTRCFTWVSKGYRDEFLRYRKQGTEAWTVVESFKEGDGRSNKNKRNDSIYNRLRSITSDGTWFTSHKCIIDLCGDNGPATDEVYEYQAGYDNNWTPIYTFTLRNKQSIIDNGFQFVQVTDQQGFNQEEYEQWKISADYIKNNHVNKYRYKRWKVTEEAILKRDAMIEATETSENFIYNAILYHLTNTAHYNAVSGAVSGAQLVRTLPTATAESATSVVVGTLYKLSDDGTKYAVNTEDTIALDTTLVTSAPKPSTEGTNPQYVFLVKLYYSKNGYTYEKSNDVVGDDVQRELSLPTAPDSSSSEYIYVGTYYKKVLDRIDFGINTGDATQNGNRINEWLDYFSASAGLFGSMEQMYTVGNNDLCPQIPYTMGSGDDTTKVNPVNVLYFFTFEHPYEVPKSASGKYIPCVYSFIYGNTYFLCMNSELSDSGGADQALFGSSAGDLYTLLKQWCINDLSHVQGVKWKIAYCHESPFTLLIQSVLNSYNSAVLNYNNALNAYNASSTTETQAALAAAEQALNSAKSNRGAVTSHMNSKGSYFFAPLLELYKFNLCLCGHKHTYSNSYYMADNAEDRMRPYVYRYPRPEDPDYDINQTSIIGELAKKVMTITEDKNKWYVKYVMCQATGYKTVSNKENPGREIGWLESYYPIPDANDSKTCNSGQRFPHYILWSVGTGVETIDPQTTVENSRDRILGEAFKLKVASMTDTNASNKPFNYNTRNITYKQLSAIGGNGLNNSGNNNIIVESKLWEV